MAKSHCTCTCIKSSKEYCLLCVKNIARLHKCIHVMTICGMRKSLQLTRNYNCLMGTITSKIHPITPTLLKDTLAIIYKAFWFFLLLSFFAYFSFVKHIMHGYIRERKEIPNYIKLLTLHFCNAEAYRCHFMIGRQQWWDGYLYLSLRIF